MDEFSLIQQYFSAQKPGITDNGIIVGIGDDAAVISPGDGKELLFTTDTLINGIHFPEQSSATAIAHKALSVNLSDIAAMGGQPRWFTLALSLPSADAEWLKNFSSGLFSLADKHAVSLVGGDTAKGRLSITISVIGTVAPGKSILRSGARPGDAIFVTGSPGMAALALADLEGDISLPVTKQSAFRRQLDFPQPRLQEGAFLSSIASSMIDISDGLAADLGHILAASGCAANIDADNFSAWETVVSQLSTKMIMNAVLFGGDDYELLFTVPEKHLSILEQGWHNKLAPLTRIGEIVEGEGIVLKDSSGNVMNIAPRGYNHFDD